MKQSVLIFLLSLIFLISPAQQDSIHVDLDKYAGKWFVIASIPNKVDKNWNFVTETYTIKSNGNVSIETTYIKKRKTKKHSISSKGFPVNDSHNARWKVKFWWPAEYDYVIEELAPDYSYVVVGEPNKKYLYIMARTNVMDEQLFKETAARCKARGYDVAKLNKVPQ